jgi:hypothetical protein
MGVFGIEVPLNKGEFFMPSTEPVRVAVFEGKRIRKIFYKRGMVVFDY